MKPSTPLLMWAAVGETRRSRWIHSHTVRRTRREARAAYLDGWNPEFAAQALSYVTFEKVAVQLAADFAELPR